MASYLNFVACDALLKDFILMFRFVMLAKSGQVICFALNNYVEVFLSIEVVRFSRDEALF